MLMLQLDFLLSPSKKQELLKSAGGNFVIDEWLREVKQRANPEDLGMILVHNGIVRATSKKGSSAGKLRLFHLLLCNGGMI